MAKLLWVSRHTATAEQIQALKEIGFEDIYVSDVDAYMEERYIVDFIDQIGNVEGIFCVHPRIGGIAIKLGLVLVTVVSENRAPIGEPPKFVFSRFQTIRPPHHFR